MMAAVGGDLAAMVIVLGAFGLAATVVAAIWWLPLAVAATAFNILNSQLRIDIGVETGYFRLAPLDMIGLIAFAASGLRLLSRGNTNGLQALWLAVTAAFFASFLYGAMRYGFATSGTFYRHFFYLSSGALYAISFAWEPVDIDRFVRLWLTVAAMLAALCISLWLVPGWLEVEPETHRALAYVSRRVLPASSALILSQAGLIGLAIWIRGRAQPATILLTVVFLLLTLLLFHRSVWIVTLAGIAVMMMANARNLFPIATATLVVGIFAGIVTGIVGGFGEDLVSAPFASAFSEAVSSNSSLEWRIIGWEILLQRTFAAGPLSIMFGDGFGVGYDRMIGWSQIGYSPHNVYLEIFINAGLVGLGLWLLFHVAVLKRLWTGDVSESALMDRGAAIALWTSLLVFGLPYSPPT
ncbi:MAG: O-antigen ligase family protein, partial [Alphaproteobacteria bacterium]